MDLGEPGAILAGEEAGAGGGGHRARRLDDDARAYLPRLGLPASRKRDLRGLGRAVGAEELLARARIVEEERGAPGRAQQRIKQRDERGGGAQVGGDGLLHRLAVDMGGG